MLTLADVEAAQARGSQAGLEEAARYLETNSRGTEREDEHAALAANIRALSKKVP